MRTEKPSERIRYALQALQEFAAQPNCYVDMSTYAKTDTINGKPACFACLGGAAAIKRRKLYNPKTGRLKSIPGRYAYEQSLNHFRLGSVGTGFDLMGLPYEEGKRFDRYIPAYQYLTDPKKFIRKMEKLANDLEKAGY